MYSTSTIYTYIVGLHSPQNASYNIEPQPSCQTKTNDKKPHENSFLDEERRRFSSKKLCSRRSLTFLVNSISPSSNIKTVLRQVASMSKKIESNLVVRDWKG